MCFVRGVETQVGVKAFSLQDLDLPLANKRSLHLEVSLELVEFLRCVIFGLALRLFLL